VRNKLIGSNFSGGKQVETRESMIGQERMEFREIPTPMDTKSAPSAINIKKGLTCRVILPWTTLERPKNHRWVPDDSLGKLASRWVKMTDQTYSI